MSSQNKIFIFLFFVFAISCCIAQEDKYAAIIGIWEYRQANSGTISGFDPEGERIEFKRKDGLILGTYFGIEREGEHGLFYSAVYVTELTVSENGVVSFTVPERNLFSHRPESPEDAKNKAGENNGITRYPLKYTGFISDGVLILNCFTENGNCPDSKMEFYKDRWK